MIRRRKRSEIQSRKYFPNSFPETLSVAMNRLSVDLLKIALRLEDSALDDDDVSYGEIMILEVLGTPTGAYLAEASCDPEAVRELILAGVEIGRLLSENHVE